MIKHTSFLTILVTLSLIPVTNFSQVTFSENTFSLVNSTLKSGVAIGIADMNGDGMDDIIRLDSAKNLEIEYQSTLGIWSSLVYGPTGSGSEWSLCVADVDRNGYNDIFTGGSNNGLKLIVADALGTNYTNTSLPGPSIFLQGSNFADIDNNGTIDIFGCHDNGVSSAYSNDGLGGFTYDLGLINATSTIPSDNSGNYGSTWTDYDNDGDLDMYLSKCRLGVSDPNDGRRINMLFQNDGNNNFTDVAQAAGLRPLAQSWATDFADIDNDGDLDAFMLNHDMTSQFYLNNGDGTFTDFTSTSGVTTDLAAINRGIQCKFEDFDNDGYVDLLVTGREGEHRLFWNNGNLTFTAATAPFATGGLGIQSAAIGDLNQDGFIDVIAAFATGYNTPSSNSDMLFYNNGNSNNFFNLQLIGTTSNANAIGARVEIYGSWGKQIREVRAGESYGVFNTFTVHFGIGTANSIDSVIVRWPSGNVDQFCSPNVNVFLPYTEGTNPQVVANFTETNNNLVIDFTDASTNQTSWAWNFGDGNTSTNQNPSYTYANAGTYNACLTVSNGCSSNTTCQNLSVCTIIPGFIDSTTSLTTNFTDTSSNSSMTWAWSFGDGVTSSIQNPSHTYSSTGTYNVCLTVSDTCGTDSICKSVAISITSVNQLNNDFGFTIYPNPIKDIFNVEIKEPVLNIRLIIQNILGEEIINLPLKNTITTIDVSDLPRGMYLITIQSKKNTITKKVMKQ